MRKRITIIILAIFIGFCLTPISKALERLPLPIGSDILSVPSNAAVPLPRLIISGSPAQEAQVTNIGSTLIYFSVAGAAPTTSSGDTIYPGGAEKLQDRIEVQNFQAISATGTGTLYITYFQ